MPFVPFVVPTRPLARYERFQEQLWQHQDERGLADSLGCLIHTEAAALCIEFFVPFVPFVPFVVPTSPLARYERFQEQLWQHQDDRSRTHILSYFLPCEHRKTVAGCGMLESKELLCIQDRDSLAVIGLPRSITANT